MDSKQEVDQDFHLKKHNEKDNTNHHQNSIWIGKSEQDWEQSRSTRRFYSCCDIGWILELELELKLELFEFGRS